MQDIITMSNKELHRVEILQKLIDRRLIEHEAAEQLDLSVRYSSVFHAGAPMAHGRGY